jgi:three-Cys-motif partner protein
MPLRFEGDAICLSGLTGSKLKCEIIADYYPFWWSITSGGPSKNYRNKTAIIELNAASGEIFVEETGEKILGSAGHALDLKVNTASAGNLKIILIEENKVCYNHLKRVIQRRWNEIPLDEAEGPIDCNYYGVYLINKSLNDALESIEEMRLGNTLTLFYFDPLRMAEYESVEKVAAKRIRNFKTGTEFIIFVFTSDWFLGRGDFSALPHVQDEEEWTSGQKKTVKAADKFFGDEQWRSRILNSKPISEKEEALIREYKLRLHKWFRYVLALPFNPKKEQIFHLIICSNYEVGIRMTKDAYAKKTGNARYAPDVNIAFKKFMELHPETSANIKGRARKPIEWKILWRIIRQHEDGLCDPLCEDLRHLENNPLKIKQTLDWLKEQQYLESVPIKDAWNSPIGRFRYKLNWGSVTTNLGISHPEDLKPISPEQFKAASKLIEAME